MESIEPRFARRAHIRQLIIADMQDRGGILDCKLAQRMIKQLARSLANANLRRDEQVLRIKAACRQHSADLRRRQVHVGDEGDHRPPRDACVVKGLDDRIWVADFKLDPQFQFRERCQLRRAQGERLPQMLVYVIEGDVFAMTMGLARGGFRTHPFSTKPVQERKPCWIVGAPPARYKIENMHRSRNRAMNAGVEDIEGDHASRLSELLQ